VDGRTGGRWSSDSGELSAGAMKSAAQSAPGVPSEVARGVGCNGDGRRRWLYGGGRTVSDSGSSERSCAWLVWGSIAPLK
jgi:hypothetical protein